MSQKEIEFEHKYVVDDTFNFSAFQKVAEELGPEKSYDVEVVDRYFIPLDWRSSVIRHRRDNRMHQLTYKSIETDSEKRVEVNLDLDAACDDATVDLFVKHSFGRTREKVIKKSVNVFYFTDCEVVFYKASHEKHAVNCVEFEVRDFKNDAEARSTLEKYEKSFGFAGQQRERRNLLRLLLGH